MSIYGQRIPTVLHVSPHPDDELLGAGCTLLLLRDQGFKIVNLACSLGRRTQHQRRRSELQEASGRSGFDLRICDPLLQLSTGDDVSAAEDLLVGQLGALVEELSPILIVSPQEHDGHHAHEVVGRATRQMMESVADPPTLWSWGLWADLPRPTVYVPYGEPTLARVSHALDAYQGENARNDYRRLLKAKAITHAVLGSERVFGFGSATASPLPYADLLTEEYFDGVWRTGVRRLVDPVRPFMSFTNGDPNRV
jgi:LmbE family N-acetylglucosaminyl deacetylase